MFDHHYTFNDVDTALCLIEGIKLRTFDSSKPVEAFTTPRPWPGTQQESTDGNAA